MRLRNILIVVEDIEKSKKFYHDLFGLDVILDNEGNVILTEGLVLQEKTIWKKFLERDIISESNSCELYFEEKNIEAFVEKLDKLYPDIKYVNRLMTHSWGQKIVRFYEKEKLVEPSRNVCQKILILINLYIHLVLNTFEAIHRPTTNHHA